MSEDDAQRDQIEIARALESATQNIAEVVEILLDSVDDSEAVMRLSKLLGTSKEAAVSVCDALLRQLTITRSLSACCGSLNRTPCSRSAVAS